MQNRAEFGIFIKDFTLLGQGAEIGVELGIFSRQILSDWPGKLYLIDPWRHLENWDCSLNLSDEEMEKKYLITFENVQEFGDRAVIIRKESLKAEIDIPDESLDFVYIDANHEYEAIMADLEAWYKKVRRGGIVAGHDYLDGVIEGNNFGVKSAVDSFAKLNGLTVLSTSEEYPTWYFQKL